ncbi:MAG TPA: DUF1553 domain-containing protein [Bryobacteraceae bacterium]|nr:DUF1553 domain-containing protein [Bryobacteraceae bacterium]
MLRSIAVLLLVTAVFAAEPVDFARQVRPILSDNCFHCHGPDSSTRMAGLRLDRKEDVFAQRTRGAAVVAKNPEGSALYRRVAETNPARRMPPASAHKVLTPAQIATLKQWIEQGAPWQEHWAFNTPGRPAPPKLPAVSSPIDRFLLARLQQEKLTFAPQASKRTLIRRVALDLTGLPPSPLDLRRFIADVKPGWYERMIDWYLASPHYGEHRARYWLDAARYGDTHGIHIDNYRAIWPYRDWVINAFNRNLPFDQFTVEQLAGDMLPNATLEQKIATGFHRSNVTTSEGGAIDDEYYEIYAKDRADTTGAVWLGLTVGCATCHDHKFDPISQKDFYSLGAFFRNTPQRAMDGNVGDTPPFLLVPHDDDRDEWDEVQAQLRTAREEIDRARREAFPRFQEWLRGGGTVPSEPLGKDAVLASVEKLDAEKPFSISGTLAVPKMLKRNYTLASHRARSEKNRGWALEMQDGLVSFRITGDDSRSIEIKAVEPVTVATTVHIVASYDGSRHQAGLRLFLNGREVWGQGRGTTRLDLPGSIGVDGIATVNNSMVRRFRMFNRVVTESEAAMLGGDGITWYLAKNDEAFQKSAAALEALSDRYSRMARRAAVTLVMQERSDTEPFAHILHRGAYDQKRERVAAGTPSALPPMQSTLPRNRLGFSKWLFAPDHPLTSRVAVNRIWQEIFGTGLVRTADDFGSQGEPPSHPELLDWLAVDFRESGWNMKRVYKQVLMTAAYRQESQATPLKLARDPDNRLLSRGPRFRMDGEMIRDYALAASGLLARRIGGPSVKPYQPDGVWEAVAMFGSNTRFYSQDDGEGLYRRSLYTFWKRSAPPASLDIFNAPSRESCTVRRERTNTPLQALATMNDEQFVEAARVLAQTAMQASLDWTERLATITERVLGRPLTVAEVKIVRASFDDYRKHYGANPAAARKLLQVGKRSADPTLNAAESAAWTMVANQLLNLDEVLNK